MGGPVADVYVSVWDERGFSAGWDFTDHDGKYEITLPAGSYKKIWFIPPEGIYLAHTYIPHIVVVAGQTITVDVTLQEGGLISGRVTDEAGIGIGNQGHHTYFSLPLFFLLGFCLAKSYPQFFSSCFTNLSLPKGLPVRSCGTVLLFFSR
jgi:hypothetical protein